MTQRNGDAARQAAGVATGRVGIWHQHDFRIAWAAGFVNDTGDWVLTIALPLYVFERTGSGAGTALLFVCQLVATAVLGPVGGALVDRWNLRRCLIVTNLAQAVTLFPLLAVRPDRTWPAYVVVILQAVLTQANNPANVALIPRVVHSDQLTVANAALAASRSLARLLGAPIGGLLVAWGGLGPVVAVDAASFVLVAGGVWFLRADTDPIRAEPVPDGSPAVGPTSGAPVPGALRAQVIDGLHVVRSRPALARLLAVHGVAQIAQGAFLVLFVAFVVNTLGDDGSRLGLIRGMMAVGGLVGAALIGRLAGVVSSERLFGIGLIGMALASYLFWNSPSWTTSTWVLVVLFAASGVPGAAVGVGLTTTLQARSPRHALGRVVGLLGTGEAIGSAIGSIAAGALIDHFALRPMLNAQATIYLLTGVTALVVLAPLSDDRCGSAHRDPPPVSPLGAEAQQIVAHRDGQS